MSGPTTCERCGYDKVPPQLAAQRVRQFGVVFCTSCKSDKIWVAKVRTTKG